MRNLATRLCIFIKQVYQIFVFNAKRSFLRNGKLLNELFWLGRVASGYQAFYHSGNRLRPKSGLPAKLAFNHKVSIRLSTFKLS